MLSTLIERCWDQTSCEFSTKMMTDLLRGVFNNEASGVVFKQGEVFAKYFGCHGREAKEKYTSIYFIRPVSQVGPIDQDTTCTSLVYSDGFSQDSTHTSLHLLADGPL